MYKKLKYFLLVFACAFTAVCYTFINNGTTNAEADGISEIAMELNSGTVMHSKNADKRMPMASTTKIMTALIVAEECNLDETVTVPEQAVGVEGSSIYLKHGETISVKDLLYGLMLRSGNDAACALAIIHSGTVEKFVEKMNDKAQELGAENTHFTNPSGLPSDEHYTTARDLCNIARYAMTNEVFSEVVGTKNYNGEYRSYINKNKLLSKLDGANGVKTGYTQKAGRCLVSSAKREDMDVVTVVLNCYDMYERSERIINSCFARYAVEKISEDTVFYVDNKPLKLDKDYCLVVEKDKELEFKLSACTDPEDGQCAGKLEIYCQNNLLFSHNLYTIN